MVMVFVPHFFWRAIMQERRCGDKDYKERMALRTISLQLIEDCYKGKPSNKSISDFLTRVSLLRDKACSKC
jgi:hypothetical protein